MRKKGGDKLKMLAEASLAQNLHVVVVKFQNV